jgi:hypothetical protein
MATVVRIRERNEAMAVAGRIAIDMSGMRRPFPMPTRSAYSVSIGNWQQFALVGGSTMRMAVDGPHDDGSLYERYRRADPVDTERMAAARPDTSQPSEQLHREECYHELRAHRATDNHSGARDADDKPERTTEGGWKWKGLELDPAANRIADDAIAARREGEGRDAEGNYAEAGITPAMRCIEAELEHGSLVPDTERFALKSPDRFKEKLAKLIADEPDKPPAEHCREIHDGIRYTFILDADAYSRDVLTGCAQLKGHGYELVVLKNTWESAEYKGINSRWLDSELDVLFEVQFHTRESWSAKQQTHDSYERINDLTTPTAERERLRHYQGLIAGQLEAPHGWREIHDYRQEGW